MRDTYGKLYPDLWEGSMVGAGPVKQLLMAYAIANSDENGIVEINPVLVAFKFGTSIEEVLAAVDYLTSPDPNSRSKAEDGRRLIRAGQFSYSIVNHDVYAYERGKGRAAYWQEWRKKRKGNQNDPLEVDAQRQDNGATVAQRCAQPGATHTNANAKAQTEGNPKGLGLGGACAVGSSGLGGAADLHAQVMEGLHRLAKAISDTWPKSTKHQNNTFKRIIRQFCNHVTDHPENLDTFDVALECLEEAKADGKDAYRLWLHLVKKRTCYQPKARDAGRWAVDDQLNARMAR